MLYIFAAWDFTTQKKRRKQKTHILHCGLKRDHVFFSIHNYNIYFLDYLILLLKGVNSQNRDFDSFISLLTKFVSHYFRMYLNPATYSSLTSPMA